MAQHTANYLSTSRDSKESVPGGDKAEGKLHMVLPLVSGPEEPKDGERIFITPQTESETSHVSEWGNIRKHKRDHLGP